MLTQLDWVGVRCKGYTEPTSGSNPLTRHQNNWEKEMFGLGQTDAYKRLAFHWHNKYNSLVSEHNRLVNLINKKGGQRFLDKGTIAHPKPSLSLSEVKSLIMLCHPDRHDGKESAKQATQMLLKMKSDLEK